jgi:hypothetical protein
MGEGWLTEMQQGALATQELFKAYVEAGFTEDQALRLIAYTISPYSKKELDG